MQMKIPEMTKAEYEFRKAFEDSGVVDKLMESMGMNLGNVINVGIEEWDSVDFVVCTTPDKTTGVFHGKPTLIYTKCHHCSVELAHAPNVPDVPKICMDCAIKLSKETEYEQESK